MGSPLASGMDNQWSSTVNELRLSAACHVANADDLQLAEVVKKWWDMESYGTLMVADKRTKEDKLASEILNSTIKFNGDRYEVRLLWNRASSFV